MKNNAIFVVPAFDWQFHGRLLVLVKIRAGSVGSEAAVESKGFS